MKDGMEYAEMLGLTVSSCDVVVKPTKKRKRKEIKEQVVEPPVESQSEEIEKVDLTEFEELKRLATDFKNYNRSKKAWDNV